MPQPEVSPDHGLAVTVAARDGFPLAGTLFGAAPLAARAKILLAPATGVAARFYRPFARCLASHGFDVLVIDYRGIGASRPARFQGRGIASLDAGFGTWARLDLAAAWDSLAARLPALPMAYIGHSLGGQVFPLLPQATAAQAVMLVAAQVGWVGHWLRLSTLPKYVGLMGALAVTAATLGYGPGRVFGGEDLPPRVARDWLSWGFHPRYLAGWHADARGRAAAVAAPVACLGFSDDLDFAPPVAVDALSAWYPSAAVTRHTFGPADVGGRALGHFGFFREDPGEALWPWAADWLMHALGLSIEADHAIRP